MLDQTKLPNETRSPQDRLPQTKLGQPRISLDTPIDYARLSKITPKFQIRVSNIQERNLLGKLQGTPQTLVSFIFSNIFFKVLPLVQPVAVARHQGSVAPLLLVAYPNSSITACFFAFIFLFAQETSQNVRFDFLLL